MYLEWPLPSKNFSSSAKGGVFEKRNALLSQVGILLASPTKKAKDIVFRFIIEYSSFRDFGL